MEQQTVKRWLVFNPHQFEFKPNDDEWPKSAVMVDASDFDALVAEVQSLRAERDAAKADARIARGEIVAAHLTCHQCGGPIGENGRCAECDEGEVAAGQEIQAAIKRAEQAEAERDTLREALAGYIAWWDEKLSDSVTGQDAEDMLHDAKALAAFSPQTAEETKG